MSYRIEYGSVIPAQDTNTMQPARLRVMTAVFLLLFAFLVRQFFPSCTESLRQILLPGTPTVTQTALDSLMWQLRDGESLGQALTTFGTYIVNNDQVLFH